LILTEIEDIRRVFNNLIIANVAITLHTITTQITTELKNTPSHNHHSNKNSTQKYLSKQLSQLSIINASKTTSKLGTLLQITENLLLTQKQQLYSYSLTIIYISVYIFVIVFYSIFCYTYLSIYNPNPNPNLVDVL